MGSVISDYALTVLEPQRRPMSSGIRAELLVDADGSCPVTRAVQVAGTPTLSISRGCGGAESDRSTVEFMLDSSADVSGIDADLEEVFDYGSKTVYRAFRERGARCPCSDIERFDCPLVDAHTHDGQLYLVFHAVGMDQLRDVISTLQERYSTVDVRRLLRSRDDPDEHELVFVDRGSLTDRQREVLETAHGMGYFEHPKRANAGEVAETLGISPSTFSEHLSAAQSKLMDALLDSG